MRQIEVSDVGIVTSCWATVDLPMIHQKETHLLPDHCWLWVTDTADKGGGLLYLPSIAFAHPIKAPIECICTYKSFCLYASLSSLMFLQAQCYLSYSSVQNSRVLHILTKKFQHLKIFLWFVSNLLSLHFLLLLLTIFHILLIFPFFHTLFQNFFLLNIPLSLPIQQGPFRR